MQRRVLPAVLLVALVIVSTTLLAGRDRMEARDFRSLHVFDALGNRIGLLVQFDHIVYLDSVGAYVSLNRQSGELNEPTAQTFHYAEHGCQGQPFIDPEWVGWLLQDQQQTSYFVVLKTASVSVISRSRWEETGCIDQTSPFSTVQGLPVAEVSLNDLGLSFPLPTPLYVAPD